MAVTKSPRLGLSRWSAGTDLHPNRAEWDAQQAVLDDLVAVDKEVATWADRPNPIRGTYMWVVDEQRLYRATATGWLTTAKIGGGGRGTPITIGAASAAVEGSSAYAARADHTHNLPLASASVPGAMSSSDKVKLDAATASSSPSTMVSRDSTGKSAFGMVGLDRQPSATSDATRKDYVDAADAAGKAYTDAGDAATLASAKSYSDSKVGGIPLATSTTDGLMPKADKSKLDGATVAPVVGSMVVRDDSGRAQFNTPLNATDAANKQFVELTATASASSAVNSIPAASSTVDGLMVKADKSKLDGATSTDTASRMMIRDSAGRARVKDPSAAQDISTKAYTDTKDAATLASANSYSDSKVGAIPLATATVDGLMPKADKALIDTATVAETANALVKRTPAGDVTARSTPASATGATSKSYVDGLIAQQVTAATSLTTQDLSAVTTDGNYVQTSNSNATTARNYPEGGTYAGLLVVSSYSSFVFQTYTLYNGSASYAAKTFRRVKYGSNWSAWREVAFADLATSSADGLMSKADKADLDSAGNDWGALVRQASSAAASTMFKSRVGSEREALLSTDFTRKAYVDTQIGTVAGGKETTIQDWNTALASADTGVIAGWPKGCPAGKALAPGQRPYQGFVFNPTWKFEVRPEGLGFVTQRATLLDCQPVFMVGFVWERVYNPSTSKWSAWWCVDGDTGVIRSVAKAVAEATAEEPLIHNTGGSTLYDSSDPYVIQRVGGTVHLSGQATSTLSALEGTASGTATALGWFVTMSESGSYVPGTDYTLMCGKQFGFSRQQGSGKNSWHLDIYTNNNLRANRYGPDVGSSTSKVWLPFTTSYPAPQVNTNLQAYLSNI